MATPEEYSKIRRHDREKGASWIVSFLARAEYGTLATARGNQPFMVTRNFAYAPAAHAIYMHGARKGRSFENAAESPPACFSASRAGRLLPADRAVNLGTEFSGVVVFGRLHIVENYEEALHGLQLLCDKYFPHMQPGVDYEPPSPADMKVTAVLRIDIESWSGKEKTVPDDFPGAFYFDDALSLAER